MTDLRILSAIFAAVLAIGLFVGSPWYDRFQDWRRVHHRDHATDDEGLAKKERA